MSIHIEARGFTLTRALEQYILRRIERVFNNRDDSMGELWVRVSDINGPRGGADKCCRVHIVLPRQRDVFVQDVQPDLYAAVDKAFRRAGLSLSRRVAKIRTRSQRCRLNSDDHAVIMHGAST